MISILPDEIFQNDQFEVTRLPFRPAMPLHRDEPRAWRKEFRGYFSATQRTIMKRRVERLESVIKVYVLSKAVQKSFIFRTVLLSASSTMEDVWGTYQMTSLQPVVLSRLLKQRSNLRVAIRLPRERSVKVCLTCPLLPSQRMSLPRAVDDIFLVSLSCVLLPN